MKRPSATRESRQASPAAVYSRNIPVSSNEDLLEIIATAPRRSVIVLSDDGPYQIGGRAWSFRAPGPLSNADLTIKAEVGVRPILKFAADARLADRRPANLLHFAGGHVTIEGVVFDLDVVLPEELVAAVRADGIRINAQKLLLPAHQLPRRPKRRGGFDPAGPPRVRRERPPARGLCRHVPLRWRSDRDSRHRPSRPGAAKLHDRPWAALDLAGQSPNEFSGSCRAATLALECHDGH